MKPINSEERKKAFLKFFGLLSVTQGLIAAAVYFGVRVPFKQNERLKTQVDRCEKEQAFTENFSARMSEVKASLDTINRGGVQTDLADGKITQNLKSMNSMIDADSVSAKKFY